jgi:hypothetical protein
LNSIAAILPLKIKRGNKNGDRKEKEKRDRKDPENRNQGKRKDHGNRKENKIMNEYRKENENENRIEKANSTKKENTNQKDNKSEENLNVRLSSGRLANLGLAKMRVMVGSIGAGTFAFILLFAILALLLILYIFSRIRILKVIFVIYVLVLVILVIILSQVPYESSEVPSETNPHFPRIVTFGFPRIHRLLPRGRPPVPRLRPYDPIVSKHPLCIFRPSRHPNPRLRRIGVPRMDKDFRSPGVERAMRIRNFARR